jgi:hypothetical protein
MDRSAASDTPASASDSAPSHNVFDLNRDLGVLAALIAEDGIEAVAASGRLDPVVRAGRRAGAFATLVALVADDRAPAVARERAFGRLASHLTALRSTARPRVAA